MAIITYHTYMSERTAKPEQRSTCWFLKLFTLLDLCVSPLRRGHANLLCIVPILTDDPRRESNITQAASSRQLVCVCFGLLFALFARPGCSKGTARWLASPSNTKTIAEPLLMRPAAKMLARAGQSHPNVAVHSAPPWSPREPNFR